jgi:hypothetical protein
MAVSCSSRYKSLHWREHPLVPETPKHERMLALAVGETPKHERMLALAVVAVGLFHFQIFKLAHYADSF